LHQLQFHIQECKGRRAFKILKKDPSSPMHPCTAQNTHHVQSQLQATSPKKLSHPIMTPKEPIIIQKIVKKNRA